MKKVKNAVIFLLIILSIILSTILLSSCDIDINKIKQEILGEEEIEKEEKNEIKYLDISINQVKNRFEDKTFRFYFIEEEKEDGLTKFVGKNSHGRGDATLILLGNKELNRLSKITMEGVISPNDKKHNTYNAYYILGLINSVVQFNEAEDWILEGIKSFGDNPDYIHKKSIDGVDLKLYTSENNKYIIFEVL